VRSLNLAVSAGVGEGCSRVKRRTHVTSPSRWRQCTRTPKRIRTVNATTATRAIIVLKCSPCLATRHSAYVSCRPCPRTNTVPCHVVEVSCSMFEHSLEVPGLHDSLLSTILTLQFEYHLTIYCLCFTLKPPGSPVHACCRLYGSVCLRRCGRSTARHSTSRRGQMHREATESTQAIHDVTLRFQPSKPRRPRHISSTNLFRYGVTMRLRLRNRSL
jgi:hypothetical protein